MGHHEGTQLTLLPTTMPVGIFGMAFRFEQDPVEDSLRQNTGNLVKDTGQAEVRELPILSVGYPDDNYNYGSVTTRSRRCMNNFTISLILGRRGRLGVNGWPNYQDLIVFLCSV